MNMKTSQVGSIVLALACAVGVTDAMARKRNGAWLDAVTSASESNHSFQVPAAGSIEVAFSPSEGSEPLVIKVIDSARRELRVLSYSFTSAPVTAALLRAKKRGVDVRLVADQKNNVSEDRSGKARAALSAQVNAGIDVRTISVPRPSRRLGP
jgi:phosphatidylserine/phosphatidylglycerophosphate/cardiolipin synthase-like enzyme